MKYTVAVALTLTTLATAQLDQVPECAAPCLLPALGGDGCSLIDFKCHCGKPDLVQKVQPCVKSACPPADQTKLIAGVSSICAAAGVPITIPTEPSSTPAPSSTTAPAPPSSTTAPAPPSSTIKSSSVASQTSASVSQTSGSGSSITPVPTPTHHSNVTTPKPTTTGPPTFPGAAGHTTVAAGLFGFALAAVAVFII